MMHSSIVLCVNNFVDVCLSVCLANINYWSMNTALVPFYEFVVYFLKKRNKKFLSYISE